MPLITAPGRACLPAPPTSLSGHDAEALVDLVAGWSRACAFVRGLGADELYDRLAVLPYVWPDLEQLSIVATIAARRTTKPKARKALGELTKVLLEFQLLADLEEKLSIVQRRSQQQPPKQRSLLSAANARPIWMGPERDHNLAEANTEFRDRKRRAVEVLADVLPRAEAEVIAVVAKDLLEPDDVSGDGPPAATAVRPRRRRAGGTRRRKDLDVRACAAVAALEACRIDWRPQDVARELGLKDVRSLTGTKVGPGGRGRVDRCPAFMRLWAKQKRLNAK